MLLLKKNLNIPAEIENARPKFALAIPVGTPTTVADEAIEMLSHVTDKTIKHLSK